MIGTTIGYYRVLERLGEGGMDLTRDETRRQRFLPAPCSFCRGGGAWPQ